MAETKSDKPPVDPLPPWAGIALSILALGFFAFHVAGRLPLDGTALILLGAAVALLYLPHVSKLKLGDFEVELRERVARLEEDNEKIIAATTGPEHEISLFHTTLDAKTGQRPSLAEAMAEGPWAFRTLGALSRRTGKSPAETEAALRGMVASGLVVMLRRRDGQALWGLTPAGRGLPP